MFWKAAALIRKMRVIGLRALVEYGPCYGSYGYGFSSAWEGPREPGVRITDITLRCVKRDEIGGADELQIGIEIMQKYRSGANSRHVIGSISLHGDALTQFRAIVNGGEAEPKG
jgi:hypothetical protein